MSSRAEHRRAPWQPSHHPLLYMAPAAVLYGLFVLWPVGAVFWIGVNQWDGYGPMHFVGLTNLVNLLSDPLFRDVLRRSVLWDLAGMVLPALLGLAVALLARRARGVGAARLVLLFPVLMPATAVAVVWTLVYSPASGPLADILRNTGHSGWIPAPLGDPRLALGALGLAWLWSVVGVDVVLFGVALGAIGREYVEIARLEGAGPIRRFRAVTLPGIRRIGLVALLINAALAGAVFDLIFTTTGGGPGYATILLPVDMYGRAFGGNTGQGAAVAAIQMLLGLLPALLLLPALRSADSLDGGERAERPATWPGATVTVWGVTALMMLPLAWLLISAASNGASLGDNLAGVWNAGMGGALLWSLAVAAVVVPLVVLCAYPAAFAAHRLVRVVRVKAALVLVLVLGLFGPTPVLIIPLFSLLKRLSLLNSFWGVALPEVARTLPVGILLLWAALAAAPSEVFDAAAVDGATPFRQMTAVGVPAVWPALVATAIWAFVTSWNEYLLPTLVSQDGSIVTVPVLIGTFLGRYDTQYGLLAMGTLMAVAPWVCIWSVIGARGRLALGRNAP